MSDLVDRQAVFDAIYKLPVKVDDLGYTWMIANDVLNQIDDIPSAEPERTAKVEWYPHLTKLADGHCECGEDVQREWKYCPNCGCRLEWK